MSKGKKIMLWIFGVIIIIIIALGIIFFRYQSAENDKRAVQLAQEYLAQKYTQAMQFISVRYSWIDPAIYHVTFSPMDNPNLFFEVLVPQDLTSPKEWINSDGSHFAADNYYLNYFSYDTQEVIHSYAQQIWGKNIRTVVPVDNPGLYAIKIPIELNEQMTTEEMEPFLNYDFYITTNKLLDINSKTEEKQKIFEMIQFVQGCRYHPIEILFWYQTGKDKKKEVYTDSKTWAEHNIKFENWAEISSIEDVEKIMDEQWFNE